MYTRIMHKHVQLQVYAHTIYKLVQLLAGMRNEMRNKIDFMSARIAELEVVTTLESGTGFFLVTFTTRIRMRAPSRSPHAHCRIQ